MTYIRHFNQIINLHNVANVFIYISESKPKISIIVTYLDGSSISLETGSEEEAQIAFDKIAEALGAK